MDTKRHHEISEVGAGILKAALATAGRKDLRIGAFALGNWLTDVQQFVDPPVYARALASIKNLDGELKSLFGKLQHDAPAFFFSPLDGIISSVLRRIRARLETARENTMGALHTLLENGGTLATGFKAAFRYVGYFKHVAPHGRKGKTRMDPDCYFKVYDQRFRQYFPHEHVDRPEIAKGRYASEMADGPTSRWSQESPNAQCRARDLYRYLRDDIRAIAGLLAYLDNGVDLKDMQRGWAAATFSPACKVFVDQNGEAHPIDDKDYEWNRHLALLGHALHTVEDYFAHSNFVDMAMLAIPPPKAGWQRKEDALLGFLGIGDIHARRIKQLPEGFDDRRSKWKELEDDTHVASGYFDWRDTVISISHALEELFDRPRKTIGKEADDWITEWNGWGEGEYQTLLKDTLELCADPRKEWNEPEDDDDKNIVVEWLRKKGGKGLELVEGKEKNVNAILDMILNEGPLKDHPAEVKNSFSEAVQVLSKRIGIGFMGYNLYKAVKEVTQLVKNPLKYLGKYLGDEIYGYLKKHGEVYVKLLVYDAFGANRIGCHSLINKDSGPELFHTEAMECAKAVHWYVLSTVRRHAYPPRIQIAREFCRGRPAACTVATFRCIDWLELLEYFLDHPLAGVDVHADRLAYWTIPHVTSSSPGSIMSSDTLLSLEEKYAGTFVRGSDGPARWSWEVIADANFPTAGMSTAQRKAQINKILAETNRGVPVTDGVNYAFRPNIVVYIPYQRVISLDFSASPAASDRWWRDVILDKHGVMKRWLAEGRPSPRAPKYAHAWMSVEKRDHDQFVREMVTARTAMERAYNAG